MNLIAFFRIVALLEGVSYILLLFIATPIKYLKDDPQYVKLLGMPHGLLFILYIGLAFYIGAKLKWPSKTLALVLLASIVPFATFIVDKRLLKNLKHG